MFNEGDEFSFEEIKMATGVGKNTTFCFLNLCTKWLAIMIWYVKA